MSAPAWRKSTGVQIAIAALVIAIVSTGWSLAQALRTEPLPPVPPTMLASLESIKPGPAAPPTDVEAAVESDLFSPERSAPDAPYRMPGEARPDDKPVAEPMKPVVLGTVVATDGRSFATVQFWNDRPMLVHVGDKVGEWVVKAIGRGKVTLVNADGSRADVTVPKQGL